MGVSWGARVEIERQTQRIKYRRGRVPVVTLSNAVFVLGHAHLSTFNSE